MQAPVLDDDTLLVHVEDTGSTATTYTDSDVTEGVRHVYRVKAVNAAGLSKRSNYARAEPWGGTSGRALRRAMAAPSRRTAEKAPGLPPAPDAPGHPIRSQEAPGEMQPAAEGRRTRARGT